MSQELAGSSLVGSGRVSLRSVGQGPVGAGPVDLRPMGHDSVGYASVGKGAMAQETVVQRVPSREVAIDSGMGISAGPQPVARGLVGLGPAMSRSTVSPPVGQGSTSVPGAPVTGRVSDAVKPEVPSVVGVQRVAAAGVGRTVGLGMPITSGDAHRPVVVEQPAVVQVVQREVEVAPLPAAQPSPESSALPTEVAAPARTHADGGVVGPEPEELLKKLYDPLVRRLKADLWLDRERRGALTDRWR
ncbi:hypothetical protein ACFYOT_41040 [Saccharothrix saharensis]|uniref:hypothetical protein n=1 Tax=Saccharothrix saharensis TaxID=571190 RepID=UPI0036B96F63